jgi:hypothetical protein
MNTKHQPIYFVMAKITGLTMPNWQRSRFLLGTAIERWMLTRTI